MNFYNKKQKKEEEVVKSEEKNCLGIFSNNGLAGTCFNFINSIVGSGVIGK